MRRRKQIAATQTLFVAGAFSPASFGSNLRGWWKADAGVSGATPITAIADQSGNGLTMTVFNNGPDLNATGFNGAESLDFDPANSEGLKTVTDAMSSMGNASTFVFQGVYASGADSAARLFVYLGATDRGNTLADYNGPGTITLSRSGGSDEFQHENDGAGANKASVSVDTNVRIVMVCDNTNVLIYVNNTLASTNADTFTLDATGTFTFGTFTYSPGAVITTDGSGSFSGKMRELFVLNKAIDATERGNIDTYLTTRSGS